MAILVGLGLATAIRWQAGAVVAGYVVLTLTYSTIWKHLAVLDLIAVAGGFVLRAIAGAVAVDVPMSTWFLLCTSFASLFIVTGKRYAELREQGEDAAQARATLDAYSLGYLRIVLSVSLGAAVVTYCVWAFEITEEIHGRASRSTSCRSSRCWPRCCATCSCSSRATARRRRRSSSPTGCCRCSG